MIDVPFAVKDALKNGDLKKNYRFVIDIGEWETVAEASYDPSESVFETIHNGPSDSPLSNQEYIVRDAKTYRFTVHSIDIGHTFYYREANEQNWNTLSESEIDNVWEFTGTGNTTFIQISYTNVGTGRSSISVERYIDTITIDNDHLVAESVQIDERMCSDDTIKYGLCEGTSLEFQYFNERNITGKRIQAFLDVYYKTGHDYTVKTLVANTGPTSGGDYVSSEYQITTEGTYRVFSLGGGLKMVLVYRSGQGWQSINVDDGQSLDLGELDNTNKIQIIGGQKCKADVQIYFDGDWHTISMGFFDVKKCSRQVSTGIIKVTAYNKLMSDYLDAKANDIIEEAVEEGESGVTGEATVDTILMKLLDGYSIKPKYNKASYTVPSNWAIMSGTNSYYDVSNGYKLLIPYGSISIDISHLNPNGAYRLYVNRRRIQQELWTAMGGYAYTPVRDPNYPSEEYHELRELVYADGPSSNMHLVSPAETHFQMTTGRAEAFVYLAGGDDQIYTEHIIKKNTTNRLTIYFPMTFIYSNSGIIARDAWYTLPQARRDEIIQKWTNLFSDPTVFRIEERDSNGLGSLEFTTEFVKTLPDVTLRELQSSVFEVSCQFGRLSRVTDLFEGVELNKSHLYPSNTRKPSDTLYPDGAVTSATKSMYSKLWADEGNIHKWRYLIITYKGLDGEGNEADFTLQRTINSNGTDDYNMSDNWLFRNLVWTAADVGAYADAMVTKMRGIEWFPFEMWCAGLPYLETGDEIEIPLGDNSYTSYILQRQLKGIQNLQDTYINGTLDVF